MDKEKVEGYLNSFRRIYFGGSYNTEKGTKILESKMKVLNISQDECVEIEKVQMNKYNDYLKFLQIMYVDNDEISADEKLEIDDYRNDLAITEEEADKLTIQFFQTRRTNHTADNQSKEIVNDEDGYRSDSLIYDTQDDNKDQKYICRSISNTDIQIKVPEARMNDKFYYLYNAYATKSKKDFFDKYTSLASKEAYRGESLINMFLSSFEDFFAYTYQYMKRTFKDNSVHIHDLYDFFDLEEIRNLGYAFEEITDEVNTQVELNKMITKAERKGSTSIAVGSLGFMAAYGAVRGIGKLAGSMSDHITNSKMEASVNKQLLDKFKSQAGFFDEIIDNGVINLYNAIAISLGGLIKEYEEMLDDEIRAENILSNLEYTQKDKISRVLEAISINPFHMYAYNKLVDLLDKDNYQGINDVLMTAFDRVLFEDLKTDIIDRINLMKPKHYEKVWKDLNVSGYAYDIHTEELKQLKAEVNLFAAEYLEIEMPIRRQYYVKKIEECALDKDFNELKNELKQISTYFQVEPRFILDTEIKHFQRLISSDIDLSFLSKEEMDRYYHMELNYFTNKLLERYTVVEGLSELRERYQKSTYEAYLAEIELFQESISIDGQEYAFVDYALQKYEQSNGFGKRFWSMRQGIPQENLIMSVWDILRKWNRRKWFYSYMMILSWDQQKTDLR